MYAHAGEKYRCNIIYKLRVYRENWILLFFTCEFNWKTTSDGFRPKTCIRRMFPNKWYIRNQFSFWAHIHTALFSVPFRLLFFFSTHVCIINVRSGSFSPVFLLGMISPGTTCRGPSRVSRALQTTHGHCRCCSSGIRNVLCSLDSVLHAECVIRR